MEKCHICGSETDYECRDCGEFVCDNCTMPYTQFTQIDYTLCKRCGGIQEDARADEYVRQEQEEKQKLKERAYKLTERAYKQHLHIQDLQSNKKHKDLQSNKKQSLLNRKLTDFEFYERVINISQNRIVVTFNAITLN